MDEWKDGEPVADGTDKAPEEAGASEGDFLARDLAAFERRFPDVDVAELEEDGMFRRFCGSRYGVEPLAALYEDYLTITRAVWEAARLSAEDKRGRATGSGGSGGAGERLSSREQQELREWNEANPHMKMSAKEFLAR